MARPKAVRRRRISSLGPSLRGSSSALSPGRYARTAPSSRRNGRISSRVTSNHVTIAARIHISSGNRSSNRSISVMRCSGMPARATRFPLVKGRSITRNAPSPFEGEPISDSSRSPSSRTSALSFAWLSRSAVKISSRFKVAVAMPLMTPTRTAIASPSGAIRVAIAPGAVSGNVPV